MHKKYLDIASQPPIEPRIIQMTLEEWKSSFEKAVLVKLTELDSTRTLKILDVGIFPWHTSIELSVFYAGDDSGDSFEDDVASWPGYDFSGEAEGRWPEVKDVCMVMNADYEAGKMSAATYFQAAADVMKRLAITETLNAKRLDDNFRITVLDPDNPDTNYI